MVFPFGTPTPMAIQTLQSYNVCIDEIWDNFKEIPNYQEIPIRKPYKRNDTETVAVFCGIQKHAHLMDEIGEFCDEVIAYIDILKELDLTNRKCYDNRYIIKDYEDTIWKQSHPNAFVIELLNLMITERCTLKCKDCITLMPYFESPKDSYLNFTLNDLDKFLNAVDRLNELIVIGGEPFISKEFPEYINHVVDNEKIGQITIYTNGTIIPKDRHLACLKHPKVFVYIDDYGEVSCNVEKIIDVFDQHEIAYQRFEKTTWADCAKIELHSRAIEELKEVYKKCCFSACTVLKDGYIFPCGFLAGCFSLHAMPFYMKDDFLNVSSYKNDEDFRQALLDFCQKEYFKGCNLCKGASFENYDFPVAVQTKECLPYVRYDEE